jgi:TPR repeat protein
MGSITMADQPPRHRSNDYDVDIPDKTLIDRRVAPYKFGQSVRTDSNAADPVPLFLSDYDGEPDPSEYKLPLRKDRRGSLSSRLLAGVLAAAAVAILFAMFSSDATRDIIVNAKASIAASLPAPYAAVQPDSAQLTARDTQLRNPKDGARLAAPANQTAGVRADTTVAVAPTREEITTAYQNAVQGRAPAATPPAAISPGATPPVAAAPPAAAPVAALPPAPVAEPIVPVDAIRHLDPSEIASSLKRADDLIASGDLAAARLVLRRAANAGDARAAMTLAGTYDPAILEKLGVHGFVPDVAMARVWYEKAKKFGSAEAPQRLELLASERQ